eukprot:2981428-Pyramimonas_sp.AAC.1
MREAARETWIHDVQDSRSSSEVIVHFLVRGADKLLGFWSFRVFKFNSTKSIPNCAQHVHPVNCYPTKLHPFAQSGWKLLGRADFERVEGGAAAPERHARSRGPMRAGSCRSDRCR